MLAAQVRLDVAEIAGDVIVFGLNGGSVTVTSVEEFKQQHKSRRLATILYLYTLVVLIKGAPHFPMLGWTHDATKATFSCERVLAFWQRFWEVRWLQLL